MTSKLLAAVAAAALCTVASGAAAQEVFGGVYAHDLSDGLSIGGFEDGVQLIGGWRSAPIQELDAVGSPSVHLLAAGNTNGGTNYAAVGLSWRFQLSERVYFRPGIGVAVHDGDVDFPSPYEAGLTDAERQRRFRRGAEELDLGSRVLFEPELALGYQATERLAVELSWVHVSHATIFGDQNPGLTDFGVRLNYRY